jgi:ACS family hexuronate transporter-like MFS transporter
MYHSPEDHPRISNEEKQMILSDRIESAGDEDKNIPRPKLIELLKLKQTWGVIIARSFTDPVWFFIADWLMILLVSKGFKPEDTLIAFWIPFVAADLGNFAGGGFSSWLITKGWSVGNARKAIVVFGAIGMLMLIPTIYTSNLFAIAGLLAIATFSYAGFSTMALVLPSDIYRSNSVATVSGLSGTAAGILTIISTFLIGRFSDQYSFEPILIAASIVPFIGGILVLVLIRNSNDTGKGILRKI